MATLNIQASIYFKINPNNNLMQRAIRSGLRRTVKGLRQDTSRKLRERYTVQQRRMAGTLKISANGLTAKMESTGEPISLKFYKHSPRKRPKRRPANGVLAEVIRGQAHYLPGTFLTNSGGVLKRVGRSRLPVRGIGRASAPGALNSAPMSQFIMQRVNERLEKNISHEINAALHGFFT